MSYFAVQDRKTLKNNDKSPSLGPGTYNAPEAAQRSIPQAYAPFGSTQAKKTKNHRKNKTQNMLGPGKYEIMGQISKPSITKYQNQNCIIIKVNQQGWSQFKSKSNRFITTFSGSKQMTPGPGQYSPDRKRPKSQPKQSLSYIGQKIKQINKEAYIERRKPTLLSDQPFQKESRQDIKKSKGPKGLSWSLNKKQRFEPLRKQAFTQQYKQELVDKLKQDTIKKTNPNTQSAVFASKSLKSHLQSQIYQTSNPFKVELRKMIKFKDQRPGPGAYQIKKSIAEKTKRTNRHQFFGSTVDRFSHSFTQQSMNNTSVGPGYYSPQKPVKNNNKRMMYTRRLKTQQPQQKQVKKDSHRNSYINKSSKDIPGPGSYKIEQTSNNHSEKHNHKKSWIFKSTKTRFENIQPQQIFEQDLTEQQLNNKIRRQREMEYRKQMKKKHKSAVFNSVVKRFSQDSTVNKNNPDEQVPTRQYNITQNDISEKMKKTTKKQMQLGKYKKHIENHPFMSSIDRFKAEHNNLHDQNKKHQNCWCMAKQVQKQIIQHQSPAFAAKQDRLGLYYNQQNRYTPGVGSYSKQSTLIKDSFNSRFIKINESKTKKINLWKSKYQKQKALKNKNKKQSLKEINQDKVLYLGINNSNRVNQPNVIGNTQAVYQVPD